MFCTDVLRALGREQLEGFSLAGRGVGGKGCSGIRILHWAGEVVLWWKRVHRGVEWWSLSTSAYLLLPFTFSKVPSTVHQHPPPPPPVSPRCVVGECALLISPPRHPVTAVSEGRLFERCRGEERCLAELLLPPLPTPRREAMGELTRPDPKPRELTSGGLSAVGGQLGLNVHSADGALPAGGQPLVNARLVKEVHAG